MFHRRFYVHLLFILLTTIVSLEAWTNQDRKRTGRRSPIFTARSAVRSISSSSSESPSQQQQQQQQQNADREIFKLQGRLLKRIRQVAKDYQMIEENDKIMVCISGGKDSATLLYLLRLLQNQLPISFELVAVHVDQKQPGYDGSPLINWMAEEFPSIPYHHIEEDTYSIVVDKTPEEKSFCTVCSRLRRGILYSKAIELGCNKIALGHHFNDSAETLLMNMIHNGVTKGMPARYTSKRGSLAIIRPLMECFESDIAKYASLMDFPIIPCNLCSNQADLQRPQVKLLLGTLEQLNPNAKQNLLNSMKNVKPSHMLDQELRTACGMNPITGSDVFDDENEHI
jgi:tRNA 2-thiocytidine biosynthesis protein TtcA